MKAIALAIYLLSYCIILFAGPVIALPVLFIYVAGWLTLQFNAYMVIQTLAFLSFLLCCFRTKHPMFKYYFSAHTLLQVASLFIILIEIDDFEKRTFILSALPFFLLSIFFHLIVWMKDHAQSTKAG